SAVYDGYGYNATGNRNEFSQSLLNLKINQLIEYNPEQLKQELGITNIDDLKAFNETDMPTNLKYNTSFLFGLALNYGFDKKQSLIANLNFAKLTVTGNFTLETTNSAQGNPNQFTNQQFPVVGKEQRLMIQLGYSRILGNSEKANLFVEAGLCVNNAKSEKNYVMINSLSVDLMYFDPNIQGNSGIFIEQYTGWGFGGFAGLGLNLTMNPKYTIQLLYTPSYEKVDLGPDPSTSLQHAAGLRAYYNF
ncbi:MAG: hypothetical protein NTV09_10930, partial [Bacteroidetes bacterium]|nr:hypothetical protein [Bacteroidota bacterium]